MADSESESVRVNR